VYAERGDTVVSTIRPAVGSLARRPIPNSNTANGFVPRSVLGSMPPIRSRGITTFRSSCFVPHTHWMPQEDRNSLPRRGSGASKPP